MRSRSEAPARRRSCKKKRGYFFDFGPCLSCRKQEGKNNLTFLALSPRVVETFVHFQDGRRDGQHCPLHAGRPPRCPCGRLPRNRPPSRYLAPGRQLDVSVSLNAEEILQATKNRRGGAFSE